MQRRSNPSEGFMPHEQFDALGMLIHHLFVKRGGLGESEEDAGKMFAAHAEDNKAIHADRSAKLFDLHKEAVRSRFAEQRLTEMVDGQRRIIEELRSEIAILKNAK